MSGRKQQFNDTLRSGNKTPGSSESAVGSRSRCCNTSSKYCSIDFVKGCSSSSGIVVVYWVPVVSYIRISAGSFYSPAVDDNIYYSSDALQNCE